MTRWLTRSLLVLAAIVALAGCGGAGPAAVDPALSLARTHVLAWAVVKAGHRARSFPLPAGRWALSVDVVVSPGAELTLRAGAARLTLARLPGDTVPVANGSMLLVRRPGWLDAGRSRHLEIAGGGGKPTIVAIDGRVLPAGRASGRRLTVSVTGSGSARLAALIISPVAERGSLLLHRVAELHARVPLGRYPGGATLRDQLRYASSWMAGFWPGALWQAAALEPAGGIFAHWALQATVRHLGAEGASAVGLAYEQSSLEGYLAECDKRGGQPHPLAIVTPALCRTLARSVLKAAAAVNRRPITTGAALAGADLVAWARSLAGSSERVPAQTPTVGTSREIGWTIYGFARLATDLHARRLVADALRAARVVQAHLPHGGVPPAAYGAGAPPDVSAAVVTAAGLLQLRQACALLGGCPGGGGQWGTLAQRVLVAGLDKASAVPPFGLLSGQVLNYRGSGIGCWCNHGELMLGDSYALEALRILKLGPLTPPWEKAR